jgi:LasA protease
MRPAFRYLILAALLLAALSACGPPQDTIILITATPYRGEAPQIGGGDLMGAAGGDSDEVAPPNADPLLVPTPTFIPTPNPTRSAVVASTEDQVYVVQSGDTLNVIAGHFGISIDSLLEVNNFVDENVIIFPGQSLIIPQSTQAVGPAFKIIPDSELVYGPGLEGFNTAQFLQGYSSSFLANYTEELDGRLWTGAEIVDRVALEQSLNPRILLALLEYETQWLSKPMIDPDSAMFPMKYRERPAQIYGLYRQLDWGGKMLNTGYYGWRQRGMTATLLADGMRVGLDPTINAGTAGVEVLLSQTRTVEQWTLAVNHTGVFATYVSLFGDPFQYAVEPLLPPDLSQPPMQFPFAEDETWYFTGGPHGGWGSGTAWAAVDFVSRDEVSGCDPVPQFARAVADGVIARSEWGIVIIDLDGDGFEGTGWTVMYLHLATEGRQVEVGDRVQTGDAIGHPACEGGVSWATHLHIARRYNGEWMAADCTSCVLDAPAPQLNFGGWLAYSYNSEYDGYFLKDEEYREACTCREDLNTLIGPDGSN